ncbi:DNA-formamidopyrimidine glycosylase family protein [Dyadobacter sp. CY326]|uniref:DNA-formamidopyrimidine glycosylase family protein n=1 Tax=Dyadobacter sp. CY326 TaxID=2907300 RepID=UPI001F2BA1C2|nr:DNA-formamidopyrimidine glycosylase family protein [Dyadobacter sp. CY326]MCE7066111.1 endonuclease [Dyadobacter sp. CY326]
MPVFAAATGIIVEEPNDRKIFIQYDTMPEGPSIVILREAIDALHLEHRVIRLVEGNSKIDQDRLTDQEVIAFKSWGKHFLVCFEDFTLRIHFMLFGSYLINARKKTPPRLTLVFDDAEINFYTCSVAILDQPADEIYDWSGDIMSESWSAEKAIAKLKSAPKMLACDALLDQNVFAGSGNIIKNEVLFRIQVHPLSIVGSLPEMKLAEMVDETSNYSFDFLHWKKEFTLKKHWLAHTKKMCPRCLIPFHKEYLGKTKRRSYFCENCQKLYDDN